MDITIKNELNNNIRKLEEYSPSLNSYRAETLLMNILIPLLQEENYNIFKNSSSTDTGFDFIATKDKHANYQASRIGIEYKHYQQSSVDVKHIHQLIHNSSLHSFDKVLLITNSRFTKVALQEAKKLQPIAIELLDLISLKQWIAEIEVNQDVSKIESVNEILFLLSDKFARMIVQNPLTLYQLEWRDLERLMAVVFEGIGFKVILTPASKDGGKDLILSFEISGKEISYIVEIKHWRSNKKVGTKPIKDFINVVLQEKRQSGLYLATYGYCNNAFESLTEIEKTKIRFGEQDKIVSLCKYYTKIDSGIWSPAKNLADIFTEETRNTKA
ncbi:restriction endonuclease [Bacillus cereus]|uniref:restriction endonuclease n=1 Tax=Bacillus cereus TaxID=1396 RepID=UPI000BFE55FE|nr:restriction endonuclease [Bacillus cereus]PGW08174.1 endonuclease [Bacillus cereus]